MTKINNKFLLVILVLFTTFFLSFGNVYAIDLNIAEENNESTNSAELLEMTQILQTHLKTELIIQILLGIHLIPLETLLKIF